MYSRLIEQDTWLNDTDPEPEKRISPFDHPHHFVVGRSYALPMGKDRAVNLNSRWANALLGGWILNGIYTSQTGAPLVWANGSTTSIGDYVYFGGPLNLTEPGEWRSRSILPSSTPKSADQFQFHIRTFSTTFPNLRQAGINNLDASLLKSSTSASDVLPTAAGSVQRGEPSGVRRPEHARISSTSFGHDSRRRRICRGRSNYGRAFVW